MGKFVSKLVTEDSFDATAKFVKAGQIGAFDEDRINGDEKHLHDFEQTALPAVEISPIAPTGPNPTVPQQIPPDAIQDSTGNYVIPGKRLIAATTLPEEERRDPSLDDGSEAAVSEELEQIMGGAGSTTGNADDALVAGKVSDVTADLGSKTDAELDAIEAAENDREAPRKGVLNAVAAERASREENRA